MFLPRLTPCKLLVPSLFVAAVLASAQITQAKTKNQPPCSTCGHFHQFYQCIRSSGIFKDKSTCSFNTKSEFSGIRSLGYSNLRNRDAIKMRRGGCAAFGHSCFGGHGKRSDSIINSIEAEEVRSGQQPPTDDIRAFIVNEGSRTPVETFNKDQPDNDPNFIMPSPYQLDDYLRFSPLFRKWLANNYRRSDLVAENN